MAITDTGGGERRTATVSELIRSLIADISLFVRREGELAVMELKEKSSEVGIAVGVLAGGAVLAFLAAATFIAAAVLALAILLPAWAAASVVAAIVLASAAILLVIGRARLRAAAPLAPTRTIETVQEDLAWIRSRLDELTTPPE
jgi:hypothetical protein